MNEHQVRNLIELFTMKSRPYQTCLIINNQCLIINLHSVSVRIFLYKKVINRLVHEQHDGTSRPESHYLGDEPLVEREEPQHGQD